MKVIALVGRSGAGKSAIADALTADYGIPRIKTCTTRAPRSENEFYDFLTEDDFLARLHAGDFVLADEYAGAYYGTPVKRLEQGGLIIVEPAGALELKQRLGDKCFIIGVLANVGTIVNRLVARGDDSESIHRRLALDGDYFDARLLLYRCDAIIRNDDRPLADVVRSVAALVNSL